MTPERLAEIEDFYKEVVALGYPTPFGVDELVGVAGTLISDEQQEAHKR